VDVHWLREKSASSQTQDDRPRPLWSTRSPLVLGPFVRCLATGPHSRERLKVRCRARVAGLCAQGRSPTNGFLHLRRGPGKPSRPPTDRGFASAVLGPFSARVKNATKGGQCCIRGVTSFRLDRSGERFRARHLGLRGARAGCARSSWNPRAWIRRSARRPYPGGNVVFLIRLQPPWMSNSEVTLSSKRRSRKWLTWPASFRSTSSSC
jgi:hypothetical protein